MSVKVNVNKTPAPEAVVPTVSVQNEEGLSGVDLSALTIEEKGDLYVLLQRQIDKLASLAEMQDAIRASCVEDFQRANDREARRGRVSKVGYRAGAVRPSVPNPDALWDNLPEAVRKAVFKPDPRALKEVLSKDAYEAAVDTSKRNKDSVAITDAGDR